MLTTPDKGEIREMMVYLVTHLVTPLGKDRDTEVVFEEEGEVTVILAAEEEKALELTENLSASEVDPGIAAGTAGHVRNGIVKLH